MPAGDTDRRSGIALAFFRGTDREAKNGEIVVAARNSAKTPQRAIELPDKLNYQGSRGCKLGYIPSGGVRRDRPAAGFKEVLIRPNNKTASGADQSAPDAAKCGTG